MKKLTAIILSFILLFSLCSCASKSTDSEEESGKLNIVCTIFPIYDWVSNIVSTEKANIRMLLDSGVDLHSYQPTAQDIVNISSCDVFVYIGGESDSWADDMLNSVENENMEVINLLDAIGTAAKIEEDIDGMQTDEDEPEEEEEYDEHIWLSLKNAQICVKTIAEKISQKDPDNAQLYAQQADAYTEKLADLDAQYENAAMQKKKDTVLFADRYPFRYLFDDYGINAYAAFSGCSAESEASFMTISFLADKINELGLNVVLTTESSDGKIAETVINNTFDKNMQVLSMDSLQSKTLEDIGSGTTYLNVMEKNLEVFIQAIS